MPSSKAMHPKDFALNQVWLAFRIDAIGTAFAPRGAEAPPVSEVASLLHRAWERTGTWPEEWRLLGKPSKSNGFVTVARHLGIPMRAVPEATMSLYIKDVQEGFEDHLSQDDDSYPA